MEELDLSVINVVGNFKNVPVEFIFSENLIWGNGPTLNFRNVSNHLDMMYHSSPSVNFDKLQILHNNDKFVCHGLYKHPKGGICARELYNTEESHESI